MLDLRMLQYPNFGNLTEREPLTCRDTGILASEPSNYTLFLGVWFLAAYEMTAAASQWRLRTSVRLLITNDWLTPRDTTWCGIGVCAFPRGFYACLWY